MLQRGILHSNRGGRAFHGGDTLALIDSPLLHAQSPAEEIRHRINRRGAGIENFLSCSRSPGTGSFQQVIQVLFRICTGEDDITRLSDGNGFTRFVQIGIIRIQIHCAAGGNVNRIPELNALTGGCGERNHITTNGIDTAQAVGTAGFLHILFKEHRIIVPDTQVAGCINRAAVGVSARCLIPTEGHAAVVVQRDVAARAAINRAAVGGGVGGRCRIPDEAHATVVIDGDGAISINRAAGGRCSVPGELHTDVVAQRDCAGVAPINRTAVGVSARCSIPAEAHAAVVAQRYRAARAAINRTAVGVSARCRIPAEAHISVPCHRHRAINRAAVGVVTGGRCRIPAEGHAAIVAQRDVAGGVPINRATAGVGGGGRCRIPAEGHAAVVVQHDGAVRPSINRAAVGVVTGGRCRIPLKHHAPVIAQRDVAIPINRATVGIIRT